MKNRTIWLLLLWFVIVLIALAGLFYLTFLTDTVCYTQVNNLHASEITPRGGMYYQYKLTGYDERGRERELTFQTSRLLREGAYLTVHVAPLRGVTDWAEVTFGDMPSGAQEAFAGAE